MKLDSKLENLRNFWRSFHGGCAISFSGGVDSAFLVVTARRWARVEVFPVFASSAFVSERARQQTFEVAEEIGVSTVVMQWNPLAIHEIARNDRLRCYFCKKNMYEAMKRFVSSLGCGVTRILDGTQADDLVKQRPGLYALGELGIETPLADMGFTKEEIRLCLKEWGFGFWALPSESCLATRIKYGTELSQEALHGADFELGYKKAKI